MQNPAITILSFLFFTGLVGVLTWWITRKDDHDTSQGYFLGGRSLSFPLIAGSLLLTNLSTEQMVGLNGAAFTDGLCVMVWEVVSVVALVFMAWFFLPRFLKSGVATVPQYLDIRFDRQTQLITNLIFLLAYVGILLPIVLYTGATGMMGILDVPGMLGNLPERTGMAPDTFALWLIVWAVGIIGSFYALFGGLRTVAVSDTLNGVGLFVGGFLITGFALSHLGAGEGVASGAKILYEQQRERFNSVGSNSSSVPFGAIFSGIFLLHLFYWTTNQQIIQRTFGASSLAEGQKGVLLTGAFKLLGPLYLVIPGMIAFSVFAGESIKADKAYGMLVNRVLPAPLTGFFAAAMIGAILSSFNSALNSSCTLFSLGLYKSWLRPKATDEQVVRSGKVFGWIVAVVAMSIAPLLAKTTSIFGYLQKMNGMYFIPIFAVVLVGMLSKRVPAVAAKIALIIGFATIAIGYFVSPFSLIVESLHEFHFLGLVFAWLVILMLVIGEISPREFEFVQKDVGAVDMTPWRLAKPAGIALVVIVFAIYATFADFSVLAKPQPMMDPPSASADAQPDAQPGATRSETRSETRPPDGIRPNPASLLASTWNLVMETPDRSCRWPAVITGCQTQQELHNLGELFNSAARTAAILLCCAAGLPLANTARAQAPPRVEFTRMVAHWAKYGGDDYLDFIEEAQPEVAQLGFYGGHFWSLSHTPAYKGYPAHFPVRGLKECGDWFEIRNKRVHTSGTKVIGHFNVEFLVGDPDGPDGPRGFFKFYRELWDEAELGARPTPNPMDLLEKDINGKPISQKGYGIGGMKEYWGCLRNPHWQAVLRAWVKRGIDRGVDGYIANYFYRHDCHCEHCQRAFRDYLTERFNASELEKRFQIKDLPTHQFKEIVAWHAPNESTPLRREMLRFSQISNKQAFDEVFHRYGRSLKPDLITAQWNHLGAFHQIAGDERCLLPDELWGKDESYLWYSTGGSANATDLKQGNLGEGTLQARYIRGAFDDKPFTLGKYENTRIRAAIAELAANGGAPMGFYTRFTDPLARQEIVRYYQFLKKYDDVYRANRSHAEVALLYPRSQVHQGNVKAVETFRQMGQELLNQHVLFDVLPDDIASDQRLAHYTQVFRTSDDELILKNAARLSKFQSSSTVRVSASRPADPSTELDFHFVNYNRDEPPKDNRGRPSPGGGIKDEKPSATTPFRCEVRIPESLRKRQVSRIEFMTPERPQPAGLGFETEEDGQVSFTIPEFLVYGVARLHFR